MQNRSSKTRDNVPFYVYYIIFMIPRFYNAIPRCYTEAINCATWATALLSVTETIYGLTVWRSCDKEPLTVTVRYSWAEIPTNSTGTIHLL
jgi:hypothetical protein